MHIKHVKIRDFLTSYMILNEIESSFQSTLPNRVLDIMGLRQQKKEIQHLDLHGFIKINRKCIIGLSLHIEGQLFVKHVNSIINCHYISSNLDINSLKFNALQNNIDNLDYQQIYH
jgi:hypothetical protein